MLTIKKKATTNNVVNIESHELAKVLQAHAMGKEIERRSLNGGEWVKLINPSWDFKRFSYRVYVKPSKAEGELFVYGNSKLALSNELFKDLERGKRYNITIHLQEVATIHEDHKPDVLPLWAK